jgi:hypothetical protein
VSDYDPMNTEVGGDELPKRGRGRPPGTKNKPREAVKTEAELKRLFERFKPFLSDDHKEYVHGIIEGKNNVDTVREMELLVRLMSLLFQASADWFFQEGKINGDLAKFADSLRMGIKDLNDLREKEEERAAKQDEADGLVPITQRGTAMARVEALISGDSE